MPERLKPDRLAAASRQLSEETAEKLLKTLQRTGLIRPVYQIRNSQIASALLGTIGLALFIVGVEKAADDVPVLSNGYASIFIGLAILSITGVLLRTLGSHTRTPEPPNDDPAPP